MMGWHPRIYHIVLYILCCLKIDLFSMRDKTHAYHKLVDDVPQVRYCVGVYYFMVIQYVR